MDQDEIIRLLREHRNKLVRPGVKSLVLVGFSGQGEDREQSDLDFSVDSPAKRLQMEMWKQ